MRRGAETAWNQGKRVGRVDLGAKKKAEDRLRLQPRRWDGRKRLSTPVPRVYYCTLTGGTLLTINYCKLPTVLLRKNKGSNYRGQLVHRR